MAAQAPKRARGAALEATVTTESMPGVGFVNSIFVRTVGTRLFDTSKSTLLPALRHASDHRRASQ